MATLTRFDPFREMVQMRNVMDRIFDDTYGPARTVENEPKLWNLALDVAEKDDRFLVQASVPGISAEDLEITLNDGILTIKGETRSDEEIDEGEYHVRERRFGSFTRSVTLPKNVKSDEVEAKYEDGILTLVLPKVDEVLPRKIAVTKAVNGATVE